LPEFLPGAEDEAISSAPVFDPEEELPGPLPRAIPEPIPSVPTPGVCDPRGENANEAFSEFAGCLGLFPGVGETTTPVPEATASFPGPDLIDGDGAAADEALAAGGLTPMFAVFIDRDCRSESMSTVGAETVASPRPRTVRWRVFSNSTGGGATS